MSRWRKEPAIHATLNQTACQIREVVYLLPVTPCDRCHQPARRVSTADRVAIDLDLDQPTLLLVTVGVHHCPACRHYFRCQPPFLRPDASYTNRVVATAVAAVHRDGMAMRRVPARLARDFWVRPSERSIRLWCRAYQAAFDFATDYQPWVVAEFSGVLCVDELYQGELALLLAADPAAPDGDRLVGYQLVHGTIDAAVVEAFLERLKRAGIQPAQVITDGSPLYPSVLTRVWPTAAHQLCLFHEARRITRAVLDVVQTVRKALPTRPPRPKRQWGGRARTTPSDDPSDPATQQWQQRQAIRQAGIAAVHALARQGTGQRAIARQLGISRRTVRAWLALTPPATVPPELAATWRERRLPDLATQRRQRHAARWAEVQALAKDGWSASAMARRVGLHRVTVSDWLRHGPPAWCRPHPATETIAAAPGPDSYPDAAPGPDGDPDAAPPPPPLPSPPPPPAPWTRWDEVQPVREALTKHRFLLVRRPEHLNAEQQGQVAALLASPAGGPLRLARQFLEEWYGLWTDAAGRRRSVLEAQARSAAWRTRPAYQTLAPLRSVLARMTAERFAQLGAFLRHPTWEATNNGAERSGRAFRHRQAPHFNLRDTTAIDGAIIAAACQRQAAATDPAPPAGARSRRGRRPRQPLLLKAAA